MFSQTVALCLIGQFIKKLSKITNMSYLQKHICGAPSEFVSSSIPTWQILTAHAQSFRGTRDLAFCLKVPLDSLLAWASSRGSGETAHRRRLAWTFAARTGDKYQIRLARPICIMFQASLSLHRTYLLCMQTTALIFWWMSDKWNLFLY